MTEHWCPQPELEHFIPMGGKDYKWQLRLLVPWTAKVCPVKAMVFPVVMYRYESWTRKKAEH